MATISLQNSNDKQQLASHPRAKFWAGSVVRARSTGGNIDESSMGAGLVNAILWQSWLVYLNKMWSLVEDEWKMEDLFPSSSPSFLTSYFIDESNIGVGLVNTILWWSWHGYLNLRCNHCWKMTEGCWVISETSQ